MFKLLLISHFILDLKNIYNSQTHGNDSLQMSFKKCNLLMLAAC